MTIVRFDLGCRSVGTPRLGGRRGNTGVSKGNTSKCGMFRISGEEMDGMMIRMFIRDEARGNEALSGVLFNNIQKTTSFYDLLHITSTGFHMSALHVQDLRIICRVTRYELKFFRKLASQPGGLAKQ